MLGVGVEEVAFELGAGHVGGHQPVGQLGEHLAEQPVGRADGHPHLHGSHSASAGCSGRCLRSVLVSGSLEVVVEGVDLSLLLDGW